MALGSIRHNGAKAAGMRRLALLQQVAGAEFIRSLPRMLHIMIQADIVAQLVAKAVVAQGAVLAHHGQGSA